MSEDTTEIAETCEQLQSAVAQLYEDLHTPNGREPVPVAEADEILGAYELKFSALLLDLRRIFSYGPPP